MQPQDNWEEKYMIRARIANLGLYLRCGKAVVCDNNVLCVTPKDVWQMTGFIENSGSGEIKQILRHILVKFVTLNEVCYYNRYAAYGEGESMNES